MKFAVHAVLGAALLSASATFAAPAVATTGAPAAPLADAAAPTPAHVKAVQDLLGAMQVENVVRGVAARSRFPSEDQRKAVFAKLDRMPPAEVAQRMAPPLARVISQDTATEMTRFYNTPYGKKVIHDKYNSRGGILFPGAAAAVAPEEKKERKRAAYVQASKALADAQPAIDHEAFNLLQQISRQPR